jgi:hypothetical protein
MGLFGRKKPGPPSGGSGDNPKDQPGHQAVLRHLADKEKEEPGFREQVAAGILFDLAYPLVQDERGVRIENLLAMLASVGGQQCLAPIIAAAPPNATLEQMQLMGIKGNDGRLYLFGDPPNRLLLESADSLLSLTFGAAQHLGAPVTMEMIHEEMKKVASSAGGAEYEVLDLPAANMVDKPSEWVRGFNAKIVEALDLYEVPPLRRATAIGYTIQKALEMGQRAAATGHADLDPLTAARIVLQCATRTSKVLIQ